MRSLIYLAVSAMIVVPQFAPAQNKSDLEIFADRFIAAEDIAWQQGDFTALQAIEDPDIFFHELDLRGWEAHKKYIMDARKNVSGLHQDWHFLTGDGNLFAMSYKSTGVFNGQNVKTEALMLFRRNNGKISDVWLNLNSTVLEDQNLN